MKRDGWERFENMTDGQFVHWLDEALADMRTTLLAKRESYGPYNLGKFGDQGVIVRTSDKLERLIHMERNGMATTAVDENRLDAWRDVSGYSLLAMVKELYVADDGLPRAESLPADTPKPPSLPVDVPNSEREDDEWSMTETSVQHGKGT